MLIGIAGSLCAGKSELARFLVEKHNFTLVYITNSTESALPTSNTLTFKSVNEAHDYVLENWRENFVMLPILSVADLTLLKKRPWFYLLTVDAPFSLRFSRYNKRLEETGKEKLTFVDFIKLDENLMYSSMSPNDGCLYNIMSQSDYRILNNTDSLIDVFLQLENADLVHQNRVRPDWDSYFIELCNLAAQRSNCMKRRVGAVLVKDRRIIATGYNGTPRGVTNCNEGGCARCNNGASCGEKLDSCLCLHAEENAILEAGRERIDSGKSTTMYCNTCPCLGCAKKIVQAGVHEVVYAQDYGMDKLTDALFKEAGVIMRKHTNVKSSLDLGPVKHGLRVRTIQALHIFRSQFEFVG
ncbi:Deoxycytidine monophosphate (dCMP) deaminase, partial [Nowakowskiella sp. JEL0078]